MSTPRDAITKGLVAAQIGEALANYALADKPLEDRAGLARRKLPAEQNFGILDDQGFWSNLFYRDRAERSTSPDAADPKPKESPKFEIFNAAVTEWVARVPGLYWKPGSEKMRVLNPAAIEGEQHGWTTYTPRGKSQLVTGGVGTLRFPQAEDGFRLVSLTTTCNASAGIPALISQDVWDHHRLAEGSLIVKGTVHWREMPQKWAIQFPVVQGIPRGCLMLNDVAAIQHVDTGAPIQVHPFSIMEYWDGAAQLDDFVYATADTSNRKFRTEISAFFEEYRKAKDRQGSYLIAADISNPMWDATFADPADMRVRKAAQLRLINARVEEAASGQDIVEALIKKLSSLADGGDLKRLSFSAGIDWHHWWSEGGSLADGASRLVDAAVQSGKQQALLQVVQLELAP